MILEEMKSSAPVFDDEHPFDRIKVSLTWESEDLSSLYPDQPAFLTALKHALTLSIISEKKRAFGVDVLLYEEEDRQQAEELAGILVKEYRVLYEGGRCRLTFGALEEDVGEWICEVVASIN